MEGAVNPAFYMDLGSSMRTAGFDGLCDTWDIIAGYIIAMIFFSRIAGEGGGGTGLVINSNIKRDDPSSAKRTLSSRLTFRPDNALKFLKKKKKDDDIIEDIAEGS